MRCPVCDGAFAPPTAVCPRDRVALVPDPPGEGAPRASAEFETEPTTLGDGQADLLPGALPAPAPLVRPRTDPAARSPRAPAPAPPAGAHEEAQTRVLTGSGARAGAPALATRPALDRARADEAADDAAEPTQLTRASSAPSPYAHMVGRLVGAYRLVELIGEGGMGAVFKAQHSRLGKKAAVKVLAQELAHSQQSLERFFHEAKAVSDIGHENIVEVFDFDTDPELGPYIVMELLEGESLGTLIDRFGRLDQRRATDVALQLAVTLQVAHDKGVIHRDLKPDNVMLITAHGRADVVKVLDFGIAKLSRGHDQQGASRRTKTGIVLGTPCYMSPEQCEGIGVDHRSDVYALGVLLFQMLTGQVPFDGPTFGAIYRKHLLERPPAPTSLRPDLDPRLEEIVLRCLSKEKPPRFASMADLASALRPVLADLEAGTSGLHRPSGSMARPATGPLAAPDRPAGAASKLSPLDPGTQRVLERITADRASGVGSGSKTALAAVLLLALAGLYAVLRFL